ncbi:hypothetical protein [Dongia sp.]|uniref:hypothetical protein n=1 Tax=Dongia sp. TaxID=1977262 RepID=UPI0035B00DAC
MNKVVELVLVLVLVLVAVEMVLTDIALSPPVRRTEDKRSAHRSRAVKMRPFVKILLNAHCLKNQRPDGAARPFNLQSARKEHGVFPV